MRATWAEYEPIWGYVYEHTVYNLPPEIDETFWLTGLAPGGILRSFR